MSALPYREWLKLATTNGYLLTESNYEELEIGQSYFIIRPDYIGFFVTETNNPESSIRNEKVFEINRIYHSADLLPYREILVPLGGKETRCGACIYPALLYFFVLKTPMKSNYTLNVNLGFHLETEMDTLDICSGKMSSKCQIYTSRDIPMMKKNLRNVNIYDVDMCSIVDTIIYR